MKANILTLVVLVFAIISLAIRYAHEPWTPIRIAAVVIGVPSLALLIWARVELGGSFSVRPKAQALVTHGLYSRIRNPIYVFGALVIASAFLYVNQPKGIAALSSAYSYAGVPGTAGRKGVGSEVWRGIPAIQGTHVVLSQFFQENAAAKILSSSRNQGRNP